MRDRYRYQTVSRRRPESATVMRPGPGSLLALTLLASSGCAPQATTDYQGDPLFSMTGRVELQLSAGTDEHALIPGVAYLAPDVDEVRIADAEVQGEFPAQFRLDLYTPPPAEVVTGFRDEDLPEEPHRVLGYIAAVTKNHLPRLYMSSVLTGGDTRYDQSGGYHTMDATTADGVSHTGTVTLFCAGETPDNPAPIFDPSACEISARTGDPMFVSIARDPDFAGAASDYAIAYLESAAPAGGVLAEQFGSPAGLAAGYHLLHRVHEDPANGDALQKCFEDAKKTAADRYNAAHGTNLGAGSITISNGEISAEGRGLRGEWFRVMAENHCLMLPRYTPVSDPNETVSLQVQPSFNLATSAYGL